MASSPSPRAPREAHVVVVGAGGLGCPAAWALAEAGVGRLTILDPDRIEPSNLPRQVLYREEDVGRPKALVAAERLSRLGGGAAGVVGAGVGGAARVTGAGGGVRGVAERLDHHNADALLGDADLLIDATDGALTKDWLNALAVRRGLPLVHAAGLRSEGRILDVPAGGRPCLACLFGRLEDDTGRCADLGVWGGVVGAIGFLAAATALRRLAGPDRPSEGYLVLDLEDGRAFTLTAEAASECPVCGAHASTVLEAYPAASACGAEPAGAPSMAGPDPTLDLVEEVCPMNLLRARRAVESQDVGDRLVVLLGPEGAASVPDGLRALGHEVLQEAPLGSGLRLVVRRGSRGGGATGASEPLSRDALLRFARQVVLPEVGEDGQRRLLDARVRLAGRGHVVDTARVYLTAAGVGGVRVDPEVPGSPEGFHARITSDGAGSLEGESGLAASADEAYGPSARALGALLADAVARAIVLGGKAAPRVVVDGEGRIMPGTVPHAR